MLIPIEKASWPSGKTIYVDPTQIVMVSYNIDDRPCLYFRHTHSVMLKETAMIEPLIKVLTHGPS